MRESERYKRIATSNWPAMAEMLMGPVIAPEDRETRRIDALQLARALLVLAGESEIAAKVPVKP